MDIGTENLARIVNVGSAANLYSLYSTAVNLMGARTGMVALALAFLENGACAFDDCGEAYEQLVRIHNVLVEHPPGDAVWDAEHPNILAPWDGHLASDITSCADLYTTSEGEPLILELLSLLNFADSTNQNIVVLG